MVICSVYRCTFLTELHQEIVDVCDEGCCISGARRIGHKVSPDPFFDTVRVDVGDSEKVMQAALKASVNLRQIDGSTVSIALDETTMLEDVDTLFSVLNGGSKPDFDALSLAEKVLVGCCVVHE